MSKYKKLLIAATSFVILAGATAGTIAYLKGFRIHVPPTVKISASQVVKSQDMAYYTAHRGLSAIAPENTLPAITKAGEKGYYACEFDIYRIKDGEWVLMHDATLDRMTNGTGEIRDFTYEELSNLRINSGKRFYKYWNLKIPTLNEALDVCDKYDMIPMIEIKGCELEDLEDLLAILNERGIRLKSIIIDFSFERLEFLRELDEELTLWYLVSQINDETIAQSLSLGENSGIAFNGRSKENYECIEKILNTDLTVATWTIDSIKTHDLLYDKGIRYFTTNRILPY